MKKYLFILFFVFTCPVIILAQNSENIKRDSLKIDGLKRILPSLKDTARINCLNNIAEIFLNRFNPERRTDSAFIYSAIANKEAIQMGYKYGEVMSLLTLTRCKQFVQQISASEKYIRKALSLSLELKDDHLLGRSYYLLAAVENTAENYKKAIFYFQKTGDVQQETEVTTWLCMFYSAKGEYEEGFPYCEKCMQLARKNVKKDTSEWGHELVQWSFFNMYMLYKAAGDYQTAMDFALNGKMYADISDLYCQMQKYDSALYYWNIWKKDWKNYAVGHQAIGNTILAEVYIKTNKPGKALALLEGSIATFRQKGKDYGRAMIRPLFLAGEAYSKLKKPVTALKYVKEGVAFAVEKSLRPEMMNGYQLLSSIYNQLGENKNAYESLLKYINLKDSIQNRQFLLRLYNYKREAENAKKESRIGFLNRDNKIKQQQLKQQATFRNFLIAIFIAIIFAGLFIFRNINLKRKNERLQQQQKEQQWKLKELESENKHVELQKQSAELEMQALRAQMNPHFIFNSLSSINHFILKNESKIASNYLTRFSRLIRMVLINSQKPLIALEDELQMLELYLEMERLRFKSSFDYAITFLNAIDSDNIFIPPLLLQPFCENAIWHGLMHLPAGQAGNEGAGRLDIELSMQDKILNCIITDNGVGREKAEEMKSKNAEKEKSMGLRITTERLALLNREKGLHTFYEIEDLIGENGNAAGTKVTLKISFKESVEETV
jgi:hypothetical protein